MWKILSHEQSSVQGQAPLHAAVVEQWLSASCADQHLASSKVEAHDLMNTPQISITTSPPIYDQYTREFRQGITFRSFLPLDGEQVAAIAEAATGLFHEALHLNELLDHEWPPNIVSINGEPDRKSGVIVLSARADRRRPIVLDA
jgi:hypothetical protein